MLKLTETHQNETHFVKALNLQIFTFYIRCKYIHFNVCRQITNFNQITHILQDDILIHFNIFDILTYTLFYLMNAKKSNEHQNMHTENTEKVSTKFGILICVAFQTFADVAVIGQV